MERADGSEPSGFRTQELGSDLVLIINSHQFGNFGNNEALFGLQTICDGPRLTTLYRLDGQTLEIKDTLAIPDFQASVAECGGSELKLGGETRGACESGGRALLLQITAQLKHSTIWKDTDPFPSNVQSVASNHGETFFAVKRQRPIGARRLGAAIADAGSKRWGDSGEDLLEFSILRIGLHGAVMPFYDSAFGLSAFAQGLVLNRGNPVIYGSLGGGPALSTQRE